MHAFLNSPLILDSAQMLTNACATYRQLASAIGDAQAVICATGFKGLNPRGFDDVDRVVSVDVLAETFTGRYPTSRTAIMAISNSNISYTVPQR